MTINRTDIHEQTDGSLWVALPPSAHGAPTDDDLDRPTFKPGDELDVVDDTTAADDDTANPRPVRVLDIVHIHDTKPCNRPERHVHVWYDNSVTLHQGMTVRFITLPTAQPGGVALQVEQ